MDDNKKIKDNRIKKNEGRKSKANNQPIYTPKHVRKVEKLLNKLKD